MGEPEYFIKVIESDLEAARALRMQHSKKSPSTSCVKRFCDLLPGDLLWSDEDCAIVIAVDESSGDIVSLRTCDGQTFVHVFTRSFRVVGFLGWQTS